jgi:hypothetical protein
MYIINVTRAREIRLLLSTLPKTVEKLIILPLCILPLSNETSIQISTKKIKNIPCDERYDFSPDGLKEATIRKDSTRMMISDNNVIALNLALCITNKITVTVLKSA